MKRLVMAAVFGISSGLLWAHCASVPKLPPKDSPEAVQVFYPGSYPTEEFKTIATLSESAPLSVPDESLIAAVRRQAASMGADAVLIRSIRRTTEGQAAVDLNQEERKIIEAVAVYYPSKHPDVQ
ncbi:MAG: hypothetical protein ACREKI_03470 [Gemmatimonadota bacterium]